MKSRFLAWITLFLVGAVCGWALTLTVMQRYWSLEPLTYDVIIKLATIVTWPATLIVALAMFRAQIAEKIEQIKRFETPMGSGEFELPVTDSNVKEVAQLTGVAAESES